MPRPFVSPTGYHPPVRQAFQRFFTGSFAERGGQSVFRDSDRLSVALMGTLIGLLLGAYTVAKVLRDSLFITEFGASALPYGYIAVAIASAFFAWLDPILSRWLSGSGRFALAIAVSTAAAFMFPRERSWFPAAFYVWTGSQLMMLIPHFWLLALEMWDSRRARAVFPVLSGFGLAGGLLGGTVSNLATPRLGVHGLLWILVALLLLASVIHGSLLDRRVRKRAMAPVGTESRVRLIIGSPFLRYLVAAIILSVVVATLIDFQFKYVAQKAYPQRDDLTRFLGAFHAGLNGIAMLAQFGAAGWLLRRVTLGASAGIQTGSVLAFSFLSFVSPASGILLAMRWVQGVVFQTIGKSSTEIYYQAVRPPDRRRIKPALDVMGERSADAFVGVLLVALLGFAGVNLKLLAVVTAAFALFWLFTLLRLQRKYTEAFHDSLARRWIEPDLAALMLRDRGARRSLVDALQGGDEELITLALEFCQEAGYRQANASIRAHLRHPSARVRTAAVRAMQALGISDPDDLVPSFLTADDEPMRRAALDYLITRRPDARNIARQMLEGDDPVLREWTLDLLATRRSLAADLITAEWIDRLLASLRPEDRVAGTGALAFLPPAEAVKRLLPQLRTGDLEVKRAGVRSAATLQATTGASGADLSEEIISFLGDPDLSFAAVRAIAAAGNRAVPRLEQLIGVREPAVQGAAAHALALIGSRAARDALVGLTRRDDPALRHVALRNLNRIRLATGQRVLDRTYAHRLFLRELGDYRRSRGRAMVLGMERTPELRLLAESFAESAERALERACRAIGCWYEVRPLEGVYYRLRAEESDASALEYLGEILPRREFRIVRHLFEERQAKPAVATAGDGDSRTGLDPIIDAIERAWEGGDAWLRACAVRAARATPGFDLEIFRRAAERAGGEDPMVQAELANLAAEQRWRIADSARRA